MSTQARREREKTQRRNAILDAAEALFFEKGFAATTMDEVAARAELSKGTVYLYFSTKDEVQLGLNVRAKQTLWEMMHNTPACASGLEQVLALGRSYLRFALEQPNYHATMLSCMNQEAELLASNPFAQLAHEYGEKTLGLLVSAVVRGQQDGSVDPMIAPLPTSLVLWGQLSGLTEILAAKRAYFSQQGLREAAVYEMAFDLMRKALSVGSGYRSAGAGEVFTA